MNGIKKREFDQTVLVPSVEQVKIGREDENETLDIVRKFEFMRLSGRHEKHAGWLNFVFVAIDDMVARTLIQV